MKKFKVVIPYWSTVTVEVKAKDEEQAQTRALNISSRGGGKEDNEGILDSYEITVEEKIG